FLSSELVLLNPIFFIAAVWATVAFWRAASSEEPTHGRAKLPNFAAYLFSMGGPLFFGYALFTLHSRVLPNWIAASILPLFCLMGVYWESRYHAGLSVVKTWLATGLSVGLTAVVLLHDTNLVGKIVRRPLPPDKDPLRQVRVW